MAEQLLDAFGIDVPFNQVGREGPPQTVEIHVVDLVALQFVDAPRFDARQLAAVNEPLVEPAAVRHRGILCGDEYMVAGESFA